MSDKKNVLSKVEESKEAKPKFNKTKEQEAPTQEIPKQEISKQETLTQEILTQETPTQKAIKREVKKQIERNEMICVKSVVEGRLTYISPKTGMTVIWSEFGAEEYLEFGELLTMKASKSRFLTEPWLVVEDGEVALHLGLTQIYEKMVGVNEVEKFFRLNPKEIEDRLKVIPNGTKTLLADKARKMIQENTLYDMRVIKILEKELMVDLQILMD